MINQDELSVNSPNQTNSFSITKPMLLSLRQTKPWARLLSIIGFIFIGFMVIGGTISMVAVFKVDPDKAPALPMVLIGSIFNLLFGLLYFFPSFYLFKFASSIGRLLDGGGTNEMEQDTIKSKIFLEIRRHTDDHFFWFCVNRNCCGYYNPPVCGTFFWVSEDFVR